VQLLGHDIMDQYWIKVLYIIYRGFLFYICYFLSVFFLGYLFIDKFKINFSTLFFIIFIISLFYQLKIFKKNKPKSCLSAFKFNNISGLILFLSINFI